MRGEHPAERLEPPAGMYAKAGKPIGGKARTKGLKFVASDGGWSYGDGPEVSGPGIDLVMAISGRVRALESLSGALPSTATVLLSTTPTKLVGISGMVII